MGRGIQVVFDSIKNIVETIPDFLFVIIGDGYASETLKDMINRKKNSKICEMGWLGES